MKSVTRNGRSILLTAVFAIILVYLFSIIGFIFFKDDFLMDADEIEAGEGGAGAGGETMLSPEAVSAILERASCSARPEGGVENCTVTEEDIKHAAAKYGGIFLTFAFLP